MSLCFFHVVVSTLRRYVEPAIWGILSTVEMFLLDSHHLPDAYEDYSGVVSWMSFVRAVVFHLQQYVDFRGFELPYLVQICRDSCRVVSWIDPCFKVDFTLYFQYKMNLETLSKDGYIEKTVKLYFYQSIQCLSSLKL